MHRKKDVQRDKEIRRNEVLKRFVHKHNPLVREINAKIQSAAHFSPLKHRYDINNTLFVSQYHESRMDYSIKLVAI